MKKTEPVFVFNFKAQFVPAIERGDKLQTIRAERKDKRRPQVDQVLKLYTGMRSPACRLICGALCNQVSTVQMFDEHDGVSIIVDGHRLTHEEAIELAKADGFNSRAELVGFFFDTHGLPFEGFLTKWELPPF